MIHDRKPIEVQTLPKSGTYSGFTHSFASGICSHSPHFIRAFDLQKTSTQGFPSLAASL